MENKKIGVLLADDWEIARKGLKTAIDTVDDIEVIGEADTSLDAILKVKQCHPDVVMMDLKWFGDETAGYQAIKQIKAISPHTKIIAITAYENLIRDARRAGADDALTKTFTREQLIGLIRDVVSRKDEVSQTPPEVDQHIESLTERELEVLTYVAKGYTDKRIGSILNIAESTAKNHVKSILSKLDAENRTEAASKARDLGLLDKT